MNMYASGKEGTILMAVKALKWCLEELMKSYTKQERLSGCYIMVDAPRVKPKSHRLEE